MIGRMFIISAPSGTGKTTVTYRAIEELKDLYAFERIITYTTRAPRNGEIHGYDYYFLSEDDFKEKIKKDFFFEWSTWYGAYYGMSIEFLDKIKNGISCVAILDRYGAREIKKRYDKAILIWIFPESLEILKQRLIGRGDTSLGEINTRLEKAKIEIEEEREEKLYDFHLILTDIACGTEKLIKLMKKFISPK